MTFKLCKALHPIPLCNGMIAYNHFSVIEQTPFHVECETADQAMASINGDPIIIFSLCTEPSPTTPKAKTHFLQAVHTDTQSWSVASKILNNAITSDNFNILSLLDALKALLQSNLPLNTSDFVESPKTIKTEESLKIILTCYLAQKVKEACKKAQATVTNNAMPNNGISITELFKNDLGIIKINQIIETIQRTNTHNNINNPTSHNNHTSFPHFHPIPSCSAQQTYYPPINSKTAANTALDTFLFEQILNEVITDVDFDIASLPSSTTFQLDTPSEAVESSNHLTLSKDNVSSDALWTTATNTAYSSLPPPFPSTTSTQIMHETNIPSDALWTAATNTAYSSLPPPFPSTTNTQIMYETNIPSDALWTTATNTAYSSLPPPFPSTTNTQIMHETNIPSDALWTTATNTAYSSLPPPSLTTNIEAAQREVGDFYKKISTIQPSQKNHTSTSFLRLKYKISICEHIEHIDCYVKKEYYADLMQVSNLLTKAKELCPHNPDSGEFIHCPCTELSWNEPSNTLNNDKRWKITLAHVHKDDFDLLSQAILYLWNDCNLKNAIKAIRTIFHPSTSDIDSETQKIQEIIEQFKLFTEVKIGVSAIERINKHGITSSTYSDEITRFNKGKFPKAISILQSSLTTETRTNTACSSLPSPPITNIEAAQRDVNAFYKSISAIQETPKNQTPLSLLKLKYKISICKYIEHVDCYVKKEYNADLIQINNLLTRAKELCPHYPDSDEIIHCPCTELSWNEASNTLNNDKRWKITLAHVHKDDFDLLPQTIPYLWHVHDLKKAITSIQTIFHPSTSDIESEAQKIQEIMEQFKLFTEIKIGVSAIERINNHGVTLRTYSYEVNLFNKGKFPKAISILQSSLATKKSTQKPTIKRAYTPTPNPIEQTKKMRNEANFPH